MKKLRWYFKKGTKFEEFTVLYDDGKYIMVQNDNTNKYSYKLKGDFGTLYGFPVNQSCLSLEEVRDMLNSFIEIDKSYIASLGDIAKLNIKVWNEMLNSLV